VALHLSKKQAQKLGLIEAEKPASRTAPPTLKSRLTKPQKKMSYARACQNGWQFVFHHIGDGRVSCRATNRKLGKQTDWLTDDGDGRGAVLAALGEGEK
jgi:hypothetical protein